MEKIPKCNKCSLYSLYTFHCKLCRYKGFSVANRTAHTYYITTHSQTPIFCTPLSSKNAYQAAASRSLKVDRYISEFQQSLQGIYTRTALIIYPVDYVKTYGTYNTPDTGCLKCYRPHTSVNTTTPKIDRNFASTSIIETCKKYGYTDTIVNKRPRNLLNEIQNVFINGKQVKTAKITQIIPWFPRFYGTKTTGNSQRRYRPHAW